MIEIRKIAGVALVGLAASACAPFVAGAPGSGPGTSTASWQMPWQLNPASVETEGRGEYTSLSFVPNAGFIRGTPAALATVGQPLVAAPGRNRTVSTCRETVASEAMKLGAREVEAVSAGPDRRDGKGNYEAPVLMRVTYPKPLGYEVRLSKLTCIVNRRGGIVNAFAAPETRFSTLR